MAFDKVAYWSKRRAEWARIAASKLPPLKKREEAVSSEVMKKSHADGEHLAQVGDRTFFTNREVYRGLMKPWQSKKAN